MTTDWISLSDAVFVLADSISDDELREERAKQFNESRQQRQPYGLVHFIGGGLASKRDLAVLWIYLALRDGALAAPPLSRADWHGATYWRDTLISGHVQAQPSEMISRYADQPLSLERVAFEGWVKSRPRPPSPKANEAASQTALEAEMRAHPKREQKPKSKSAYRKYHMAQFAVSARQFDRIWDNAITNTGAEWNAPGAPSKLSK